jgi:hypothetical protein
VAISSHLPPTRSLCISLADGERQNDHLTALSPWDAQGMRGDGLRSLPYGGARTLLDYAVPRFWDLAGLRGAFSGVTSASAFT